MYNRGMSLAVRLVLAVTATTLVSCGDDGGSPPVGGALIEEAIRTCTWTTACLNPEDSFGGGAPNTNVSSCLATFFDQRAQPVAGAPSAPWTEYRACTASAATCAGVVACLSGRHAICGAAGSWTKGTQCPDGTWACDASCLATCTVAGESCSTNRSQLLVCANGTEQVVACNSGGCVDVGGSANCLPGTIGACATDGASCDGTTQVVCFQGIENRFDCASAGQRCGATGCQDATACTYMHEDACNGTTLSACLSGNLIDIDCTTLGGTCGTLSSGRAGCVFP
jgi:hypothetical protein